MKEKPDNRDSDDPGIEKLRLLLPYWVKHNEQHILDSEKWLGRAETMGLPDVAGELREAVALMGEANRRIEAANEKMEERDTSGTVVSPVTDPVPGMPEKVAEEAETGSLELKKIGVIRTPYAEDAPYQPLEDDEGEFRIVVDPRYADGLRELAGFRYIYVIFYVHRLKREPSMITSPPWTPGAEIGVFASRSPVRPNPIGLSVVSVRSIKGNEIVTSGLDVFDGTPLLDIKPYIKDLDSKPDANYGWIEDMEDHEHLLLHIKGIPHDY